MLATAFIGWVVGVAVVPLLGRPTAEVPTAIFGITPALLIGARRGPRRWAC